MNLPEDSQVLTPPPPLLFLLPSLLPSASRGKPLLVAGRWTQAGKQQLDELMSDMCSDTNGCCREDVGSITYHDHQLLSFVFILHSHPLPRQSCDLRHAVKRWRFETTIHFRRRDGQQNFFLACSSLLISTLDFPCMFIC